VKTWRVLVQASNRVFLRAGSEGSRHRVMICTAGASSYRAPKAGEVVGTWALQRAHTEQSRQAGNPTGARACGCFFARADIACSAAIRARPLLLLLSDTLPMQVTKCLGAPLPAASRAL
jgi:hypothetical protein